MAGMMYKILDPFKFHYPFLNRIPDMLRSYLYEKRITEISFSNSQESCYEISFHISSSLIFLHLAISVCH